jgi:uncharacterized protein YifE (UPF0438 family)
MNNREIKVKLHTTEHFVKLFNGFFDMTPKEVEVISRFLDQYSNLEGTGISPFSNESKKIVATKIGMQDYTHLNLYLKRLVDKKAIKKVGNEYKINPLLLPLKDESKIIIECQILNKN